MLNGLAAGHEPTTKYATATLDLVSTLAKTKVGLDAMHSTIGRHAARAITCCLNVDLLNEQWTALLTNMGKGDMATFNKPVFPKGEVMGVGIHEAPRGVLSHWVVLDNGKIKHYQCVVPSTWIACPSNDKAEPGPYEASLLNTPIADAQKPLEVPVSYTHLDVYKRQRHCSAVSSAIRWPVPRSPSTLGAGGTSGISSGRGTSTSAR